MMQSNSSTAARGHEALLDRLAGELTPVRPLDDRPALAMLILLLLAAAALVIQWLGMRPDLAAGQLHPMLLLRAGTLLLLGGVSTFALLGHAHPGVGRIDQGWRAAALLASLFPLSAVLLALQSPAAAAAAMGGSVRVDGLECVMVSLSAGLLCAAPMLLHLRRGAPVAPERAGMLVGLAAGSLGAFAYSLHCPFNDFVYIGVWNGLAVAVAAVVGRLVVPPLIRW
jgi:hypothetical protein